MTDQIRIKMGQMSTQISMLALAMILLLAAQHSSCSISSARPNELAQAAAWRQSEEPSKEQHVSSTIEEPIERQNVINGNQATYVEPPADFKPIIYQHEPLGSGSKPPRGGGGEEFGSALIDEKLDKLGEQLDWPARPAGSRWADWRDISAEPSDLALSESQVFRASGAPLAHMEAAVPALAPFKVRSRTSTSSQEINWNGIDEEPQAEESSVEEPDLKRLRRHQKQVKRSYANPNDAIQLAGSQAQLQASNLDLQSFVSPPFHYHNHEQASKSPYQTHNLISQLQAQQEQQRQPHRMHQLVGLQRQQPDALYHKSHLQQPVSSPQLQQQRQQQQQVALANQAASQSAESGHSEQQPRRQRRRKFRSSAEVRRIQQQQQLQLNPLNQAHLQPESEHQSSQVKNLAASQRDQQVASATKQVNGLGHASAKLSAGLPTSSSPLTNPSSSFGIKKAAVVAVNQHPIRWIKPPASAQKRPLSDHSAGSTSGTGEAKSRATFGSSQSMSRRNKLKSMLPVGLSSWFLGGIRDLDGRHWHLPADLMKQLAVNDVDLVHEVSEPTFDGEREKPTPAVSSGQQQTSVGLTSKLKPSSLAPNQLVPR